MLVNEYSLSRLSLSFSLSPSSIVVQLLIVRCLHVYCFSCSLNSPRKIAISKYWREGWIKRDKGYLTVGLGPVVCMSIGRLQHNLLKEVIV